MKKILFAAALAVVSVLGLSACQTSNEIPLKTYENKIAGYRIGYPTDYQVTEEDQSTRLTTTFQKNNTDPYFWVQAEKASSPSASYLDFEPTDTVQLGEYEAKMYVAPNGYCDGPGCSPPFIAFQTFTGDRELLIIFYNTTQLGPMEKAVYASFEILPGQMPAETADSLTP